MKSKVLSLVVISIIFNMVDTFAQNLTDTIFTVHDTIICDITLINDQNIFYTTKHKKQIDHKYILNSEVISYKLGSDQSPATKSTKSDYVIKYDTLNSWIHGIACQIQLDYPLAHIGVMYSLYKKNHNIQFGIEYLQLQRSYLKGDPIDIWDNSYSGVYLGYRYLLNSSSQKLNWFCYFSYTIFNASYKELQRGFPFEKEITEVILLNSAGLGINYKASSNFNFYSGIGLSSSKGFFLNFEEPYFNVRLGFEYRFIKSQKEVLIH
jgi:hypothetical protein